MSTEQPKTIFLKDYQVSDFLIDNTDLHFTLGDEITVVEAKLRMRRNPKSKDQDAALVLNGQDMTLLSVSINDVLLAEETYSVNDEALTIVELPECFELCTRVEIKPQNNTSLEGLYRSRTMYCTQCEAEGFRKITYYLDRPDVLSEFTTTVVADKAKYPVLLSNGNPVTRGELDNGLHFTTWHDPFKKPAYLFALVAGTLTAVEDSFTTCSGRDITLQIFVEDKDLDKCDHAMASLKNSMKWDEEVYGREYDLDIFMIVAVDDFNMGAMENKGLNIFNTSCVLAKQETTTDAGFQRVEAVVAHEYFHNWSGNRVTCRDWFQLSLKEGFTVFRDAEFSADMGSRTVKRVEDVSFLRTLQFAEDAGPMAHPVQPAAFIEISNFYTLTIYEKGAEVVRMIHTLLGSKLFRKGSDLYFDRNDGDAATIEDFVGAMEDASGRDLTQFKLWYAQAGTPRVDVSDAYDENTGQYELTFKQRCPTTPEATAEEKKPQHIPVAMGLMGEAGNLPVKLFENKSDVVPTDNTHCILELTEAEQTFTFTDLPERPIPALFRGFSAPIKLHFDYSREDLMALMSREDDGFCRWNASQLLAVDIIEQNIELVQKGRSLQVDECLIEAFETVLNDESLDPAMVALMLQLPSEAYLSELAGVVDVDAIHTARNGVKECIAHALKEHFTAAYDRSEVTEAYLPNAEQIAKRSLRNVALSYLMTAGGDDALDLCQQQFDQGDNMTEVMAALSLLVNTENPKAQCIKNDALERFYQRWSTEPLVVNQWFSVQSMCSLPNGLERVHQLMNHAAFDFKNPNKIRSVVGAFCNNNAVNFHRVDGTGYEFLADQVIALNELNPQIASRLLAPLTKWRRYDETRQSLMQQALKRILAQPELSKDVFEVVTKSL